MLPIGHARAEGKAIHLGAGFFPGRFDRRYFESSPTKIDEPASPVFLRVQRQLLFGKPKLSRCLFQCELGAVLIEETIFNLSWTIKKETGNES